MTRHADVDVLIVGAGPVGLTLAMELHRQGVDFRIVDKVMARPLPESRATGHHARTFEHWERYGDLTEKIVDYGAKLTAISAYANARRIGRATYDGLQGQTRYPYLVMHPQAETERHLIEMLRDLGHEVERPVELITFDHDPDGVDCVLRSVESGEDETVRASFLAGCDGAPSTVRKRLGLDFQGKEIRGSFLVDAKVEWDRGSFEDGAQNYLSDGKDLILWQNPEGWTRVVVALPKSDPRMKPVEPTIEFMQSFIDEHPEIGARITEIRWGSAFFVSNRLVEEFRRGRVFLCGDSAHIHDPTGGQGMNTGVLDATNAGWKIACALRGIGGEELLDSYHTERYRNVKILLAAVERAARGLTVKGERRAYLRTRMVQAFMSTDFMIDLGARTTAGLAVSYRKAPTTASDTVGRLRALAALPRDGGQMLGDRHYQRRGPKEGLRAPDADALRTFGALEPRRLHEVLGDDCRHWLFVFGGIGAASEERRAELREMTARLGDEYASVLHAQYVGTPPDRPDPNTIVDTVYYFSQKYGAKGETAYLIRPDGFIAYRGQPVSEKRLRAFLDRVLPGARDAPVPGGTAVLAGKATTPQLPETQPA